jgi:hypothetical protein
LVGARIDDPKEERAIHNHLEERRRRRAIAAKAADHSSDYRGGQNLGAGRLESSSGNTTIMAASQNQSFTAWKFVPSKY